MDQRYLDLLAAVVRQAFQDMARDPHGRGMEARRWLMRTGLVAADGSTRYGISAGSGRRSTTPTREDQAVQRRLARAAARHQEA